MASIDWVCETCRQECGVTEKCENCQSAQTLVPLLAAFPEPAHFVAAVDLAVRVGGSLEYPDFEEEMMGGYQIQANAELFARYKVKARQLREAASMNNLGRPRFPREKTPERRRQPEPGSPASHHRRIPSGPIHVSPGGTLGAVPYVAQPTWYNRVRSILPPIANLNCAQSALGVMLLSIIICASVG
jgi:hypothetical protein